MNVFVVASLWVIVATTDPYWTKRLTCHWPPCSPRAATGSQRDMCLPQTVNRHALARSGTALVAAHAAQNSKLQVHSLVALGWPGRPEPRAATGSQLRQKKIHCNSLRPPGPPAPHGQQLITEQRQQPDILGNWDLARPGACCTEATPGRLVSPVAAVAASLGVGQWQ